jgi:hypothetical protein
MPKILTDFAERQAAVVAKEKTSHRVAWQPKTLNLVAVNCAT